MKWILYDMGTSCEYCQAQPKSKPQLGGWDGLILTAVRNHPTPYDNLRHKPGIAVAWIITFGVTCLQLVHEVFMTCPLTRSWFVNDFVTTWLQLVHELFMNCSGVVHQFIHDLLMTCCGWFMDCLTCSWSVHAPFTTSPHLFRGLFMTCSLTCSWHVYEFSSWVNSVACPPIQFAAQPGLWLRPKLAE